MSVSRASSALALALASIALHAAAARAQEPTIEITTVAGDTCRSIAIRVYGDPEAVDLLHEHNPALGPLPHDLAPGTVLRLPAPQPPAELSAVRRRVERRDPDDAEFAPGRAGDSLPRGTHVRTHDASSADITFRDHTEVTVRERTLVIVYGGRRRLVERPVTRAELERGALRSRLGELAGGPRLEVETPSSQASLGGDAVVSVEEDGTSRVANHGDRPATVAAGGARVVLPADTGVVVRRGERPTRPRRLLAAPRWRADRRGFVVGIAGQGATLRGGFEPVRGAASYRVEIAQRPDGGELLTALDLGADATRFEADGVPEGTVYVSVASIDEAGLEGRRSPWRAFSVRLARLVAPGGIEVDASQRPPRVLPGTWLVPPRGLACAEGDAPSSEIVTLRGAGRVAVRCGDEHDGEIDALEIDVIAPHVVIEGALVRDRTTALELELSGDPLPPAQVLALDVPDGFHAGRVGGDGAALRADVHAPIGAGDRAAITLVLVAGAERIALATVDVPVHDPEATSGATIASALRDEEPHEARVVQGALGDLAWPSAMALRDERRRGLGAWLYVALASTEDGSDPQLRVGGGARAQIPETPLRIALASQGDPLPASRIVDRRGDLDVLASIGALLVDDALASLALDASVWFPTRREPESLGRVRLAPSLEGSLRPTEWLALRTRQGVLIDAADQGARLWAFAVGADLTLVRWLAIGVELDGSVGSFADRDGAALAMALGAELREGAFELAVGARLALTEEARALFGEWSGIASVRLFAR